MGLSSVHSTYIAAQPLCPLCVAGLSLHISDFLLRLVSSLGFGSRFGFLVKTVSCRLLCKI